jgi:hypothetical protein
MPFLHRMVGRLRLTPYAQNVGCVAEFVGNRNRNGGLAAESFG